MMIMWLVTMEDDDCMRNPGVSMDEYFDEWLHDDMGAPEYSEMGKDKYMDGFGRQKRNSKESNTIRESIKLVEIIHEHGSGGESADVIVMCDEDVDEYVVTAQIEGVKYKFEIGNSYEYDERNFSSPQIQGDYTKCGEEKRKVHDKRNLILANILSGSTQCEEDKGF